MTMPAQFPALQQRGLAKFIKLALDFSANETLDPRITFSRTSNATRTNAQGLIEYAPHNLLTYSENFDNAVWVKSNATVTANAVVAPDGTTTADKLVEDTANSQHYTNTYTATIGVTYSISFYAKTGGRSKLLISGFGLLGQGYNPLFDLEALTVSSAPSNATIQDVGNGWRRCSLTVTATGSSGLFIYLYTNSNTYTGDGTSGIYLWGAQLNIDSLQPYYTTSVKNLLGYSQNFENAAWTKSNSSVLTNLLTYSQEFENAAWTKSNATVTANAIVAPDGTLTAGKLIPDSTLITDHTVNTATVTIGTTYTVTVYAKAAGYNYLFIRGLGLGGSGGARFNLQTGVVEGVANYSSASITALSNGWYRCIATGTALATTGVYFNVSNQATFAAFSGDGTSGIYIWGAQLVQGTNPEQYTVTTSATAPIQVMGPLGFLGAEKLVENTVNIIHYTYQGATTSANTSHTLSVYCKAAERTQVDVRVGGLGWAVPASTVINLSNGSVISGSGTVVSVGSGWYRISITGVTDGTIVSRGILIAPASGGTATYTGDGTSGIYIFGAQLSDSASLDPYSYNFGAAPTSSAYYGPRFDYDPVTLAPKGLLIEEQRINILLNSDTLSTQSVSVTAQAYTLSFYGTGSVALSGAYTGSLVGTGAYPNRVQLTFTPDIGTLTLTVTGSVMYANLEAGTFPTSYIPTTSAQVTRTADNASMVGTNFSSWYNQSEGTVATEYDIILNTGNRIIFDIGSGGALGTSAYNVQTATYVGLLPGTAPVNMNSTVNTTNLTNKIASGLQNNNSIISVNTVLGPLDTSCAMPASATIMTIGSSYFSSSFGNFLNGHIKSFKFFSKRFFDTYLQRLTQ